MTLEDFFTLTEMKDGLTALSRVEELVTVMQKEKDCSVKNVGDASRQWTAVASTIAATENKDCLDLFVKLEGLWFIDKWLKDAQKFFTDTDESFLEESIITLLQALEKLHINNKTSVSSGIWTTVKDLLDHKSSTVQDRARILFDCWKQEKDDAAVKCEVADTVKKVDIQHDDRSLKIVSEGVRPSASNILTSEETLKVEGHLVEPSGELVVPNVSSDVQSERADDVQVDSQNNQLSTPTIFDSAEMNERAEDPLVPSTSSNSVQENPCPMEASPASSLEETSLETGFTKPKRDAVEEQKDSPKDGESSQLEKQEDKNDISVSCPTEPKVAHCHISAENSQDLIKQPTLLINSEANDNDRHRKNSETNCAMTPTSDSKDRAGEPMVTSRCNAAEDGECCSDALQDSSLNGNTAGEGEDLEKASRVNDIGTDDEDKEDASDEDRDFRNAYEFSKPVMDSKRADNIDKRRSDVELDYGVDALEVARRVAKAVEREVGDFKGTFCSSSSEKTSEDGPKQPDSPESINEKHDQSSEVPTKDTTTAQSHSTEEGRVQIAADKDKALDNCNQDLDSSRVTEVAQATEADVEKRQCGFDLNEDVCTDEMDHPVNPVSTTISVVSASRPATAPGLPLAPLQFEGTLGWKGSAATSAFRPASPRRNSDSDKNVSVGGTSDGSSKQRQDWLDFDLNVAEGGDDLGKQIPALSGHPSGESSVEVSPKRSERFKLDLNRIDDNSDALPSNSRMEVQHMYNRNGHRSLSPSSSSSSMQPSLRNFDLNDRPSYNDPQDQGSGKTSLTVNAFAVPKSDASIISIMGARVEVNKKDNLPQLLSLSNGKAIEPAVDTSMTGTGNFLGLAPSGSYSHSPIFGYNGLTGPAISLSPALYGPSAAIPFMDSRAPVMPQIMPSASSVPPYSQPPFIMSMTNTQPSLNGAGPSRHNFDLNSGFMVDGGTRDLGLRPFVVPGLARPMEDHLRTNSQPPSSSSLGGKRKEPDSGWEAFQFSYKQQQPPRR